MQENLIEKNSQVQSFINWKTKCLEEKSHYINWGSLNMNSALMGISGGMSLLIAGFPNQGKSQFSTSTIIRLLQNNEDLIVVDFTLDDPKSKRITQYVSMLSGIEMNDIDLINKVTDRDKIEKFNNTCSIIKSWLASNKLFIYENSSEEETIQSSMQFITNKISEIRRIFKDKKILVCIDSLNDVEATLKGDALDRSENIAKEINRCITKNNVLLIATSHLRKNGGRRPTLEDLKGNNYLAYSCKVAIGIHNDLKINKEKAKIVWQQQKGQELTTMPVVEAHFLKSKVSDFNGCICFKQWPALGKLEEPEEEVQKSFQAMVYEV